MLQKIAFIVEDFSGNYFTGCALERALWRMFPGKQSTAYGEGRMGIGQKMVNYQAKNTRLNGELISEKFTFTEYNIIKEVIEQEGFLTASVELDCIGKPLKAFRKETIVEEIPVLCH